MLTVFNKNGESGGEKIQYLTNGADLWLNCAIGSSCETMQSFILEVNKGLDRVDTERLYS